MNMDGEMNFLSEDSYNLTEIKSNIDQLFIETCEKMFDLVSGKDYSSIDLGENYYLTEGNLVKTVSTGYSRDNTYFLATIYEGEVTKGPNADEYSELDFLEHDIEYDCENIIKYYFDKHAKDLNDRYERILSKKRGK